ncbi:MAG: DNA helicase UvrD [Deltaproteobacteria bacterium]|nr:MAG: DNA helicase UvrD [Deltaproteobacteria bacterium]
MELSPQQQQAVHHIGAPALVVAGAGSGKTRTLTAKIAYLIEQGFSSDRILAITFTNKAAQEMKDRLTRITGLSLTHFPWVRTYHSACLMILKAHAHLVGLNSRIQILTPYQQEKIIKEILVSSNVDKKHTGMVQSMISNAKNAGDPSSFLAQRRQAIPIRLTDVYDRYEAELKAMNAVDFDNILLLTRDILRDNETVRNHYQNHFQYILVDEYQDSNNLQEELTRLLLGSGNLFCVGDDWQAIYGFRGSNVDHFLAFSKQYENAQIYRLEENYRSANEIVQLANGLIQNNPDKMDKHCFSQKTGAEIQILSFYDEYEEARWTTKKMEKLHDLGIPYDRMAVIYRTRFCSLAYEKAFRNRRIPYRMIGGKGFFERKEILDLNAYLAASTFPRDDVSFERIINTPRRGIGPKMLKRIGDVRTGDMGLQDAVREMIAQRIMAPKVHGALTDLIALMDAIRDLPPDAALQTVIERTGYMDYLKSYAKGDTPEYTAKCENIDQLMYTASEADSIPQYLEEAALIREDKTDADDPDIGVNLLTIHSAKGLEYKVVCIGGCEEHLFPHWKCMETEKELQEERRLMYVAMTRAEQFLYLTHANFRKRQYTMRSRFIDEVEAASERLI